LANVKKIFSSETAWPNGAKLGRKHLCKILSKTSSFSSIPTDAKWWQYLTWPFGSGELKRSMKNHTIQKDLWRAQHDRSDCNILSSKINNSTLNQTLVIVQYGRISYSSLLYLKPVLDKMLQSLLSCCCPWRPYLLAEWDEMNKFYRGPYIDAFCQVWFHLVQLFQRSRLKNEKLKILSKASSFSSIRPTNMATVTKNRTYGKIARFW
jgi:hypothetical protein